LYDQLVSALRALSGTRCNTVRIQAYIMLNTVVCDIIDGSTLQACME